MTIEIETIEVVVRKREQQADGIIALEFVDPTGKPLPAFEAGAHIDLFLGEELVRQYSLCNDPADSSFYRVGILKDPDSRGGSIAAHENLHEGSSLTISAPRNLFPLESGDSHTLLIGGGIGITPMIAMAHELDTAGKSFELWYCGRTRSSAAFVEELACAGFADKVNFRFDDEERLDLDGLLKTTAADAHLYTCGPGGFMEWVMGTARNNQFTEDRIHKEFFQVEVDTSGDSFEVYAQNSDVTVTVGPEQTIVDALAEAGVKIKVSCEQGTCGTCLCDVIEGTPDHRDVFLTEEEKEDNDQILVCCSRAKSDRLVLDI